MYDIDRSCEVYELKQNKFTNNFYEFLKLPRILLFLLFQFIIFYFMFYFVLK